MEFSLGDSFEAASRHCLRDYIIAVLRFLSVRHLAVIDQLELEFEPGLSVLTGETGAGKSILVGAVGLLVGGRASADLVRTGEETGDSRGYLRSARSGDELIVRREISAQGRSRAFLDGALATSAALRELRRRPRRSARPARAPGAARSGVAPGSARRIRRLRRRTRRRRGRVRALAVEHPRERDASADRRAREGVARRVHHASSSTRSIARRRKPGEDEELEATRQVLANADKLQRLCAEAYERALRRRPRGAAGARQRCGSASASSPPSTRASRPTSTRATRVKSQLEDLAFFLRDYSAIDRRLAGAAAGGRGSPCRARASEAEARADARGRDRQARTSSGGSSHDIEHATETRCRARRRTCAGAASPIARRPPRLTARRRVGAPDASPRRSRSRSPSSP